MSYKYIDTHSHLDFAKDSLKVAQKLDEMNVACLVCTTCPNDYIHAQETFKESNNILVVAGAHPWWIADKRIDMNDIDTLVSLIEKACLIGEIGLDFSHRQLSLNTKDLQIDAFTRICRAASKQATHTTHPPIMSIHSVSAVSTTLSILEETGCIDKCCCIFHWFSGSNSELLDAIDKGCMFSVNKHTLQAKKWKEYAKLIPQNKILLETDQPGNYNDDFSGEEELNLLETTASQLYQLNPKFSVDTILQNSMNLLGEYF